MSDRADTPPDSGQAEPPDDEGSRTRALGEAVRKRREELGLRQDEVAELAGCSTRFIHTLEHGKATLRLDKVMSVLQTLGLDLAVRPGRGRILQEELLGANR